MSYFAIIEKQYVGASRDRDQTYVNVVKEARAYSGTFDELITKAPWNDPNHYEFVAELTQQQFQDIQSGTQPLFHDGRKNLPRWQYNNGFGSYSDPTDDTSAFTLNTPLPDDRFIIRIYDGDPDAGGVHVSNLEFDESATPKVMYLKLYSPNDVPSTTNAQNQKTDIGGKRMIFDFTDGVTTFNIALDQVGQIVFPSNHRYRVIGPNSEKSFVAQIYGRTLRVE